jgi:hypothetical protein
VRARFVIPLFLVVLGAAVLGRWHPVASIAVGAFASVLLLASFHVARKDETLIAAGNAGDVETLRRIALRVTPQFAFSALVTLAVFEGTDEVEAMPHKVCECTQPDCELHWINDQIELLLGVLRDARDGRWQRRRDDMVRLLKKGAGGSPGQLDGYIGWVRSAAVGFAMLYAGGATTPKAVATFLKVRGPGRVLESALRFAAARALKMQGDVAGARAMIASLPAWKSDSLLARTRAAFERELGTVSVGSEGREDV